MNHGVRSGRDEFKALDSRELQGGRDDGADTVPRLIE
jgi:hypothetical protein